MANHPVLNIKIDPSHIKQSFSNMTIQLHCCRYWKVSQWEFTNMAFPFWRFYYNTLSGARVYYNHMEYHLNADKMLVIPPNTSFSTSLSRENNMDSQEVISGNRIKTKEELVLLPNFNMVDHFFIHFNLGLPYDNLKPGIYEFFISNQILSIINRLKEHLYEHPGDFEINRCLDIYHLLFAMISKIPASQWEGYYTDPRLKTIIQFIENNLEKTITNKQLADISNMATNSFSRWFKNILGYSPQKYIQVKRMEKASHLLHHTNKSIEAIADECGYYDRHYFSRIFKKEMKVSPAYYKKHLVIG